MTSRIVTYVHRYSARPGPRGIAGGVGGGGTGRSVPGPHDAATVMAITLRVAFVALVAACATIALQRAAGLSAWARCVKLVADHSARPCRQVPVA